MTYTSHLAELQSRFERATDAGLVAAATAPTERIVLRLQKGYTSGVFTTGNAARNVRVTAPYWDGESRSIAIGLAPMQIPYPLFWELGHMNHFTRKFERVEVWVPALVETRDEASARFSAAFRGVWGSGGGATLEAAD